MTDNQSVVMTDHLAGIISALKVKMSDKGYSDYTISICDRVWKELLRYAQAHGSLEVTAEYCNAFCSQRYGEFYENKYSAWRVSRPIQLLLDFIRLGTIIKQKNNNNLGFSERFKELIDGFLQSQRERGLKENSILAMRSRLFRLESFLLDLGIERFGDVTLDIVNTYIQSFIGNSTSTSSSSLREFGRLCDYALANGFHKRTFSNVIPHVKNLRRQRIPHMFTSEETDKLLSVVDRNNPSGKRDYAMLLIAARLGLRVGDIHTMKFDAIDWNKRTIAFSQQKTDRFLELPIPDDVGWAIIDYLKSGRPVCDNQTIFINHQIPYNELSAASVNLVAKYMRMAGISTPPNRVCGMHTLRHSLASTMLREGISLPTISSVLGHADIHSTESYLRVDLSSLRRCALEVDL